jgi:hypothetical protein
MKRLVLVALALLAFSAVPATPAFAQTGFFRWLERLSGPGPFYGTGFELYGVCFGVKKDSAKDSDAETAQRKSATWFPGVGCGQAARRDGDRGLKIDRVSIGVQYSWMRGDNRLQYDPSVPADQTDSVDATVFMGIADFGFVRALDLGAGFGFVRFSGMPSPAFSHVMFEPIRVTVKPLALKKASTYKDEALQLRVVMTVIPSGFDAEDFGAIPGTYHSGTEVQGNLYIIVNVASLFGV